MWDILSKEELQFQNNIQRKKKVRDCSKFSTFEKSGGSINY